jgi:MFS family permease
VLALASLSSFMIALAALGDRFGRRSILATGLAVFDRAMGVAAALSLLSAAASLGLPGRRDSRPVARQPRLDVIREIRE